MDNCCPSAIQAFLLQPTPHSWVECALDEQTILLIDHANCEKKAAATALSLLHRYVEYPDLLYRMSRLAREELRHFEQVIAIMQRREIPYRPISAARYASSLRAKIREQEPFRLIDTLIIGAFIEARSCERFASLVPHLDADLAKFYRGLLSSESRHFQDYLKLAQNIANDDIGSRVQYFAEIESDLITSLDTQFRFHSGAPA